MTRLVLTPAPERPDLDRLIKESIAAFEALSTDEQRLHRLAQRRSWVIGEMMLMHPEMTREEAERLVEEVDG